MIPEIAAGLGLFAAVRLLREKHDDCCRWGHGAGVNKLAVLGVGYYLLLLALAATASPFAPLLALLGFLVSCALVLTMLFTSKWCPWCFTSAVASTVAAFALIF